MSKKTVCDICGLDADDTQYVVPVMKQYVAEKDGVKLGKFERVETWELNFCYYHRSMLANLMKAWRDAYNKV